METRMSWPTTPLTSEEAFQVWLAAYQRNYGGTGRMEAFTMAEQAWLAALNYMEQLAKQDPRREEAAEAFAQLHPTKEEWRILFHRHEGFLAGWDAQAKRIEKLRAEVKEKEGEIGPLLDRLQAAHNSAHYLQAKLDAVPPLAEAEAGPLNAKALWESRNAFAARIEELTKALEEADHELWTISKATTFHLDGALWIQQANAYHAQKAASETWKVLHPDTEEKR